jgi:hypothetical protein
MTISLYKTKGESLIETLCASNVPQEMENVQHNESVIVRNNQRIIRHIRQSGLCC